jgi:hypothetical protein
MTRSVIRLHNIMINNWINVFSLLLITIDLLTPDLEVLTKNTYFHLLAS